MTAIYPLIPDAAFDGVRVMAEASLTDTVILSSSSEVQQPGGKIVTTWVVEPEQPALLAPASAGGSNIRADQPSAAGEWILKLRRGTQVSEGQQALVKPHYRLVYITKVLAPKPHEILRRALAVDVEANP